MLNTVSYNLHNIWQMHWSFFSGYETCGGAEGLLKKMSCVKKTEIKAAMRRRVKWCIFWEADWLNAFIGFPISLYSNSLNQNLSWTLNSNTESITFPSQAFSVQHLCCRGVNVMIRKCLRLIFNHNSGSKSFA